MFQKAVKLDLELIPVGQVQLISRSKQIVVKSLHCILHEKFILSCSQDNTYRRIVIWLTDLRLEIVQIQVHLSYIPMLYLPAFKINQHITLENSVIENEIRLETACSYLHRILPAYKSKATSQFKKKLFHMVSQGRLQFVLMIMILKRKPCKFKDIWIMYDVCRFQDLLALSGERQYTFLI